MSLQINARACLVGVAAVVGILGVGLVTLASGEYHTSLSQVLAVLGGGGSESDVFFVLELRLPRWLTGVLVGAALGVSGAMFQSLTRNPLGSPDVIGFTVGSASGGLVVLLLLHGTTAQTSLGALVGGLATAAIVYVLAIKRGVQGYRLILIGIGIAAMLTSVNWYLLTRGNVMDAQIAARWLTGSLNGRAWGEVVMMTLAVLVLTPVALGLGRGLRMLELGDDAAQALGVYASRIRAASVFVGISLAALAVAAAGPVGFIALAAPQVARRLTRAPGPGLLPAALVGALMLSVADLASQRIFAPVQLPVGVATGVIGGVYLAWLLGREWEKGRG